MLKTKNILRLMSFLLMVLMIFCIPVSAKADELRDNVTEFMSNDFITKQESLSVNAQLVSERTTEDEHIFRIAIPVNSPTTESFSLDGDNNITQDGMSPTSVDLNYIDITIQGSGGKVVGKAWKIGFMPSHSLNLTLYNGNTSATATNNVTSVPTTNIGGPLSPTKVESTPTASKFWNLKVSGIMNGKNFSYTTNTYLFNKKAVEYPKFNDYLNGNLMTVPSAANWSKVSNPLNPLTTSERAAYKKWYENQYNKGNELYWENVEVHHIKPRAYGGTHAYSNLMPLNKTFHSTVTTWWANY